MSLLLALTNVGGTDATANGTILTKAYSFLAGTATGGSGAIDGTASGATVSEIYSFLSGAASGGIAATANGATVSYVYSFIAGLAVGEVLDQQPAFTGGSYNFGKRRKLEDEIEDEEQDEKPLEVILIGDAPKRTTPKPEIIPIKRAKPKPAQTTNTLSRLQIQADQERAARIRRNIARSNAWLLTA